VSLHGLTSITLGVPDVGAVASYYEDFGLRRVGDRPARGLVFATAEGGEQLALRPAERRRLLEIGIGADDPDDLGRVEAGLRRLGVEFERDAAGLRVRDPNSALQVSVQVSPRITEAAAKQGAFWELHDLLLEHQGALTVRDLTGYATSLGLDIERFNADLRKHVGAARVAEDTDSADLSGVSGTPTFFVNGMRHYGAYDIENLSKAVKLALARTKISA